MRARLIFKIICISIFPFLVFGAKAPDFTVTDHNNKVHKLYDDYLNKDKVLVIKFFFVGCPPCATIGPYYQSAYVRWGSGSGRVQFMEISTLKGDYNSLVRAYHQTKGFTFPGVGVDGGAQAAIAPYTSGAYGPWYGTPSFMVIAPNRDVKFNVPFSPSDQSQLDSAIAQSLRLKSGGGGGCSNAFSVKTISQIKPETYYVVDLLNGNPAQEIKSGNYNCEFSLPENIDGHYVIPQMNAVADPTNGVTTSDIVHIQRHILGIQPLNNLQKAAGDVNNSGSLSAADVSDIRKLILGVTAKFNKLTKSFVIVHNPNSTNSLDLDDRVLVKDLVSKIKTNEFGIAKYGDVSGANLITSDELEARSSEILKFVVETKQLADGTYEHRFFTREAISLTGFQFEVRGKSNNIYYIKGAANFLAGQNFDFNLNLSSEVIRMLGSVKTLADCQLAAGETWFTIYTKQSDRLKTSYFKNFRHEFLFDKGSKIISKVEIEYIPSTLVGESVILSQDQKSNINILSGESIKKIRVFDSNGILYLDNTYHNEIKNISIESKVLTTGIYYAQIQLINGQAVNKKFVVFH